MPPRLARLYWQLTALLLAAHFAGAPHALAAAMALTALNAAHALVRLRHPLALPVQVRVSYLGLLLAGCWPPLQVLHPLQFIGVNLLLVADYCVLARLLALLPWNRTVPLSRRLLVWLLMAPPAPGAITARLREAMEREVQAVG
ncbi:hypothetical protein [uncultured Piscinibacter sp.]|uniref:hypothetical protein n=1 Tax=uncultured Piscinibacter sp. TaxID=1131835 RepID=UPI00260A31F9|nr:hypothetical protein [uncultured Piscinibacter sp.]